MRREDIRHLFEINENNFPPRGKPKKSMMKNQNVAKSVVSACYLALKMKQENETNGRRKFGVVTN
jgi:hypothetical protein